MVTTSIASEFPHIFCEEGREPSLLGHRIRVRDIVEARDQGGYSPEEIAATVYPGLTLAEVYSALAYYEDHRPAIEAAAEREAEVIANFQSQFPDLVGQVTSPKR